MAKICQVCDKPPITPRHRYCARCYKWCSVRKEIRARVKTLRERLDRAADRFTCSYCGIVLNETDNKRPDFLCFDHRMPGKRNDLAVCAEFINLMKSDMTWKEFPVAVIMLAHLFLYGTPFDKKAVKFVCWNRSRKPRPKAPPLKMPPPLRAWHADECPICGKPPVPHTLYCARCHTFADAPDFSMVKLLALKEAYDPATDSILCHYTRVLVDIKDPASPWYLNYDHVIPGDESRLVVAANFVNVMKTQLSEDEFRAIIIELARHFETGEPFDLGVCEFKYWTGLR